MPRGAHRGMGSSVRTARHQAQQTTAGASSTSWSVTTIGDDQPGRDRGRTGGTTPPAGPQQRGDDVTDDKQRRRWLVIQVQIVDTDADQLPSGSYNERKVSEHKTSVPVVDDRGGVVVALDEVSQAIRSQLAQASRIVPIPQPDREPISAPGAVERLAERTEAAAPAVATDVSDIPF